MENNEINVTEETKNAVEEVAKTKSNKGLWVAGGVALTGAVVYLITRIAKKKKAKKAEKEESEGKDWADELDDTVKEIKDEDID